MNNKLKKDIKYSFVNHLQALIDDSKQYIVVYFEIYVFCTYTGTSTTIH